MDAVQLIKHQGMIAGLDKTVADKSGGHIGGGQLVGGYKLGERQLDFGLKTGVGEHVPGPVIEIIPLCQKNEFQIGERGEADDRAVLLQMPLCQNIVGRQRIIGIGFIDGVFRRNAQQNVVLKRCV